MMDRQLPRLTYRKTNNLSKTNFSVDGCGSAEQPQHGGNLRTDSGVQLIHKQPVLVRHQSQHVLTLALILQD